MHVKKKKITFRFGNFSVYWNSELHLVNICCCYYHYNYHYHTLFSQTCLKAWPSKKNALKWSDRADRSYLSLFHPFCLTFIFLSDSIDTSIHLLPHSITSHHCMTLPSIHPFHLPLTPSSHLALCFVLSLTSLCCACNRWSQLFFFCILLYEIKTM